MTKTRRLVSTIALALFVFTFNVESLRAQDSGDNSPSMEETISWLKNKFSTDARATFTSSSNICTDRSNTSPHCVVTSKMEHALDDVRIDTGKLTYSSTTRMTSNANAEVLKFNFTYDITLADLDPASIRVVQYDESKSCRTCKVSPDVWLVEMRTSSGKNSIKSASEGKTYSTSEARIHFQDREIAKRVAKALAHAVTMAGGKVEPF